MSRLQRIRLALELCAGIGYGLARGEAMLYRDEIRAFTYFLCAVACMAPWLDVSQVPLASWLGICTGLLGVAAMAAYAAYSSLRA